MEIDLIEVKEKNVLRDKAISKFCDHFLVGFVLVVAIILFGITTYCSAFMQGFVAGMTGGGI